MMIDMKNITKTYQLGEVEVPVLKGINLQIAAGDYVSIVQASYPADNSNEWRWRSLSERESRDRW
jgi:predicted ABC-type transport system involved in lysophospholipase L1 biosynthesis ATPase subunit